MVGEDALAQRIHQERCLPVQCRAAERLHQAAQQAQRQRCLEQHRHLAGAELACTQSGQGALGRIATQSLGRGQIGRRTSGRIPAITLHVTSPASDGPDRQRVAAVRETIAETQRVGRQEVAMAHRDGGAITVGNLRADREAGRLDLARQLDGLWHGDMPGLEQRQARHVVFTARQTALVGQTGKRILAGDGGNVVGRPYRARQRLRAEIAGAGMAAPLPHIDRHPQPLVTGLLDGLDLALAHRQRQPRGFRHLGHHGGGPQGLRLTHGLLDQFLKILTPVVEQRAFAIPALQVLGRQMPGTGTETAHGLARRSSGSPGCLGGRGLSHGKWTRVNIGKNLTSII